MNWIISTCISHTYVSDSLGHIQNWLKFSTFRTNQKNKSSVDFYLELTTIVIFPPKCLEWFNIQTELLIQCSTFGGMTEKY